MGASIIFASSCFFFKMLYVIFFNFNFDRIMNNIENDEQSKWRKESPKQVL